MLHGILIEWDFVTATIVIVFILLCLRKATACTDESDRPLCPRHLHGCRTGMRCASDCPVRIEMNNDL